MLPPLPPNPPLPPIPWRFTLLTASPILLIPLKLQGFILQPSPPNPPLPPASRRFYVVAVATKSAITANPTRFNIATVFSFTSEISAFSSCRYSCFFTSLFAEFYFFALVRFLTGLLFIAVNVKYSYQKCHY
jgi:hypothetical protein